MAGTAINAPHPTIANLYVREIDSVSGLVLTGYCTGVPDTTANIYQHGATIVQTDSGTGSAALWENVGSSASPSWVTHNLNIVTVTSLGTAQNSTPTAAQLLGGVITQTSATGAGTVTLPTGTQLSTAFPGVKVGSTFKCTFANLGGGFALTITGATGSTVIGTAAVNSGIVAEMRFVNTGSNTWNVYCTVSA